MKGPRSEGSQIVVEWVHKLDGVLVCVRVCGVRVAVMVWYICFGRRSSMSFISVWICGFLVDMLNIFHFAKAMKW